MARSEYCYVVSRPGTAMPVAAFTVKHEMVSWLKRNGTRGLRFFRVPDGKWGDRPVTEMTLTELGIEEGAQ